jgi:hypothetical protein
MNQRKLLTIGVTGRRHIVPEALEAVERSAREFVQRVVRERQGEIRICTGLAVGADSIVARVALDAKKQGADNLRLTAVLPADPERYERDFKRTPDASGVAQLDAFRALLAQCDETISLADPEADARNPTACYARLGDWLVENADVLLAFWNGNTSIIKRGGTVDVALRKAARSASDGSRVVCISTPELLRQKNPDGSKTYIPEPIDGAGNVAVLKGAFDENAVLWQSIEDVDLDFC